MDVLVVVGTTACYVYSVYALLYGAISGFWSPTYFETSAMLITFVLLGEYLETLAKGKTSDAIKKLVELTPVPTRFFRSEMRYTTGKCGRVISQREIDALLIQPGDVLKVLPGAKVPVDGVVVWGSNHVNKSMATKVDSNTVLSQIILVVETSQTSKAPIQKFADYVSIIWHVFCQNSVMTLAN
nr:copper-transporting ATPase RAN1-like isoform X4 [Nicotiana tomentosiformis]